MIEQEILRKFARLPSWKEGASITKIRSAFKKLDPNEVEQAVAAMVKSGALGITNGLFWPRAQK